MTENDGDLLGHARDLEARAEELEREETEVEEHEKDPKDWLRAQPKFHWPVEPDGD